MTRTPPGTSNWMLSEVSPAVAGDGAPYTSRFAGIGVKVPEPILTSVELIAGAAHHPQIDIERLTGVHERHVAGPGEDSFSLAVGAAREALERAQLEPGDIDMLLNCSITRYRDGLNMRMEPPLSLDIKQAIGATRAVSFDISNACAGMLTGVFLVNDFIRRGAIRRALVVSGEYISSLARNAARDVRTIMSSQLASLTLGDAGAAVVVERAPAGKPGIGIASFTTLAEHSRLCVAYPSHTGPGAVMYTKARKLQEMALQDTPVLLEEVLRLSGLEFKDIDYVIPHQTSARAIKKGERILGDRLGGRAKHMVINIEEFGNTASTTHFVALHRYLEEGRFKPDDKVVLLALASGIEFGVVEFTVGELVGRYGHGH